MSMMPPTTFGAGRPTAYRNLAAADDPANRHHFDIYIPANATHNAR
jgi:hypothetical protein